MGNKCDFSCTVCYRSYKVNTKKIKDPDYLSKVRDCKLKECYKCYSLPTKEKNIRRKKNKEKMEKICEEYERKRRYPYSNSYPQYACVPFF